MTARSGGRTGPPSPTEAREDLRRVLEAFSVVLVALEGDDTKLGRHATLLLADIDARHSHEDDRGFERAMFTAALGSIAALALKQWAVDEPVRAKRWIRAQSAHYEANFPKGGGI